MVACRRLRGDDGRGGSHLGPDGMARRAATERSSAATKQRGTTTQPRNLWELSEAHASGSPSVVG